MPAKKYRVQLNVEERRELKGLVSRGRATAYRQTHARILLLSDEAREGRAMKDESLFRFRRAEWVLPGHVVAPTRGRVWPDDRHAVIVRHCAKLGRYAFRAVSSR